MRNKKINNIHNDLFPFSNILLPILLHHWSWQGRFQPISLLIISKTAPNLFRSQSILFLSCLTWSFLLFHFTLDILFSKVICNELTNLESLPFLSSKKSVGVWWGIWHGIDERKLCKELYRKIQILMYKEQYLSTVTWKVITSGILPCPERRMIVESVLWQGINTEQTLDDQRFRLAT